MQNWHEPKSFLIMKTHKYIIDNDNSLFNFGAIHAGHLENAPFKLKTSYGFCARGIPSQFVKIGSPIIAESRCGLFNLSPARSRFPDS